MKLLNKIFNYTVVVLIIALMGYNLFHLWRQNRAPLSFLDIKRPTVVFIFGNGECGACVRDLQFLNRLYPELRREEIDMMGVVLSQNRTDKNQLSDRFVFPIIITDNFSVMKRLNLRETPIMVGLTRRSEIIYVERLPDMPPIDKAYMRNGILDRLYDAGMRQTP